MHIERLNKHTSKTLSLKDRIIRCIEKDGECWIWKGGVNIKTKHPVITFQGKPLNVRRVSYELFKNKKPVGIIKCSCANKLCINPDHFITAKENLIYRFHRYYIIDPITSCWNWTKSKHSKFGYGNFAIGTSKSRKAHQVSYEIHKGKIPKGMFVCHSCDNPSCVNPSHLWMGTVQENNLDCFNKKRKKGAIGEKNNGSKITEAQAIEIKLKIKNNIAIKEIHNELKISIRIIERIKYGETWKHITL